MNGVYDVGGMDGLGPVVRDENEPVFHEPWQGHLFAMQTLIRGKHKVWHLDETRHAIERVNPVFYMGSSYYQIWLLRTEALLIEKGLLTDEELRGRMEQLAEGSIPESHLKDYRRVQPLLPSVQRRTALAPQSGAATREEFTEPKFAPGTVVRAKQMSPLGHTRIPRYIRGKTGVIDAIHGLYTLPDAKVHGGVDLYQPVYRVCFEAQHLWGEDASPNDKLYIELWEDYLDLEEAEL
jgi:nitrile hydratase beta subunit